VEDEPVAICRLKRVAADLRDDVTELLPQAPDVKNGKRVVLIGAGPASLTVANDLMPLGYDVTIFEALPKAGGLMRTNIPSFRLPVKVLEEGGHSVRPPDRLSEGAARYGRVRRGVRRHRGA
jgi:NADPH-dependent glutamate synthase beta subunit-like oxidoreductase